MSNQLNTAIVGGGILGMTLALRLAQAGQRVTLFEAGPHVGGLADAWQLGDVTWDRHYHVTLLSDIHWRRVLAELHLEQDMQWVETKTGFFTDGQLTSMSNTLEFLRFPPLGLLDKLRLGGTIFYASKLRDGKRLESIPVASWLRKLSGKRAFEKIWLPLLRAKLGENYQHTSAAFIWATIARMYAARRTGLKKEMFGYLPGGYARILEHFETLLHAAGVDVRVNHALERVESCNPKRERGRALQDAASSEPFEASALAHASGYMTDGVQLAFRDRPAETFDRVVLTTPAPIISRVCPQLSNDEHRRLNGLKYQGIVCASLLLKKPLAKYYVTNITDSWVPFTAVIEMTTLVDPAEFGGRSLVYLPKYVAPDDPLFEVSDDELRTSFIAALKRMYPDFSESDVEAFRVSRVRHVVSLSTLNYSDNLPPMKTSLPGVFAINSAHIVNGTLNVNETVKLAEDAVRDLLLPNTGSGVRISDFAANDFPILQTVGGEI
ncbi:MAG: NAD(P)/FAD-dependent oxidoreductase [Planctomycetaceae bacterium]